MGEVGWCALNSHGVRSIAPGPRGLRRRFIRRSTFGVIGPGAALYEWPCVMWRVTFSLMPKRGASEWIDSPAALASRSSRAWSKVSLRGVPSLRGLGSFGIARFDLFGGGGAGGLAASMSALSLRLRRITRNFSKHS